MKRMLAAALLTLLICASGAAQCQIRLSIADATQGENVPISVQEKLKAKLMQAVSRCGVIGSENYDQFFIAGRLDNAYSDVVEGLDAKYVVNTDLTLYVGDYSTKQIYATTVIKLKGVDSSQERAYMKCISSINPKKPELKRFIDNAKNKIIKYFNDNYNTYVAKANNALSQGKYAEAMYYATAVPECCDGWEQAQSVILKAYNDMIAADPSKKIHADSDDPEQLRLQKIEAAKTIAAEWAQQNMQGDTQVDWLN